MPAKLAEVDQMTVEEFLAFCDERPDGERWELIEGAAVLNPSPTQWHQTIVLNIGAALSASKAASGATWTPMLGVGTRVPVSPNSLPQPDVFVKADSAADSPITEDAIVLIEVLSRSNTRADQAWRRRVYASVPNCQHYVAVSTRVAEVTRYDRASGWRGMTVTGLESTLTLPAITAEIPLSTIYRWTPIGTPGAEPDTGSHP
jgi:Uma2 family endonuclease